MRIFTIFVILLLFSSYSIAQCECTDCPIFVPSSSSETSFFEIDGAINNTLGVNGQELCQVCVDFTTDAINELDFTLTAPDGSSVLLIDNTGLSVDDNLHYDICFVPCSAVTMPDPGHGDVFDSNEIWSSGSIFTGSYYPSVGCLEDLTGDVSGPWSLEIEDFVNSDDSNLINWYLVFADDDGIDCAHAGECPVVCDADAGVVTIVNSPACPSGIISFSVVDYNSTVEFDQYLLIVDDNDEVVKVIHGDSGDFTYDDCADFFVYSYNFEISGGSTIPSLGDIITAYDCNANCCELEGQEILFEDLIVPSFTYIQSHPNDPNVLLYCLEDIPAPEAAEYEDNCIASGSVLPTDLNNVDPCLGGTYTRTWEVSDSCNTAFEVQVIIIEEKPIGEYIDPPLDNIVDCDNVPDTASDLMYSNGLTNSCSSEGTVSAVLTGNHDECGGVVYFTWSTLDECNRVVEYVQTIDVNPSSEPEWVLPPMDMIISCDMIPTTGQSLTITNNELNGCLIEDVVDPTITNNYNGCEGTVVLEWDYIDPCGRSFVNTQTFTITPPPIASFTSFPGPVIINCDELSSVPTVLNYTNNELGNCNISGDEIAVQVGGFDGCGGDISYLWEYTDGCGRTISHSQLITILPAPDPVFINIPVDIILDCGEESYTPSPLEYTNNELGPCLISGFVNGVSTQIGNQIIVDWTLDLPCNNQQLFALQTVTIRDEPLVILDPIDTYVCVGEGYDLGDILITDFNNTGSTIEYYDDLSFLNPLSDTYVSPTVTTDYYIVLTTNEGCTDYAVFTVYVDFVIEIANDGSGGVCNDNTSYDLTYFLTSVTNSTGIWVDKDNSGVNISNPSGVVFEDVLVGDYEFIYYVPSTNSCPADTSIATITVLEGVELNVISILCSVDLNYYTVSINSSNIITLTVSSGTVVDNGDGTYTIIDIPITESLQIDAVDTSTNCSNTLNVTAPNCSCPPVDPPVNNGDSTICIHHLPVVLSVAVVGNQSANWYDEASGGNIVANNTLSYQVSDTLSQGIYTFYVETIDLDNQGCISLLRTEVILTVLPPPIVVAAELLSCRSSEDNIAVFLLSDANPLISMNAGYIYQYFPTYGEAELGLNVLPDLYTLSSSNGTIFSKITDLSGCYSIVEVELQGLDFPVADLKITDEVCKGNGEAIIEIDIVNGVIPVLTSLNGNVFMDSMIYHHLEAGDHTLTLQDSFLCENELLFEVMEGIEMFLEVFIIGCDDNGTDEDLTDDVYTISFRIESTGQGTSYTVSIDQVLLGARNYGELYSETISANSLVSKFEFIDDLKGCILDEFTIPLEPCSTICQVFPDATIFVDPSNILDCSVQSVLISSSEESNIDYHWMFDNSPISNLTIAEEGQVVLIAIDTISGCMSQDTLNIVDLEAYPLVSILEVDTLTCIVPIVIIDGSSSIIGSQYNYEWYSEFAPEMVLSDQTTLSVDEGGWYYLVVTDVNLGCTNVDSVFVTSRTENPVVDLQEALELDCGIDSVKIEALVSFNMDNQYSWSTNNGLIVSDVTMESIDIVGGGYYYLDVFNSLSQCHSYDSILVITNPLAGFKSVVTYGETCFGQSDGVLEVVPIDNGGLPYQYSINEESFNESSINSLSPGVYNIRAIDVNGCISDTIITIEEADFWEVVLEANIDFVFSEDIILSANLNIDINDVSKIEWIPATNLSCSDCLNPILSNPEIGEYTIVVTDKNGCFSAASIRIDFENNIDIYVPNIFNPDGDVDNRYFIISVADNLKLSNLEVSIYSRWGELIYHKDQLHNTQVSNFWDGTYKGVPVNSGVFVYKLKAELVDGSIISKVGDITVVR